jgi:hypothetical protein
MSISEHPRIIYCIDFITVKTQRSIAIPGCKIVTY